MGRWDQEEARRQAESIARAAKRWRQVEPSPPAQGFSWACNACTFTTLSTASAEDHAITETRTRPFAHILFESAPDPKTKPRRRIHSPDGRTVRIMERA